LQGYFYEIKAYERNSEHDRENQRNEMARIMVVVIEVEDDGHVPDINRIGQDSQRPDGSKSIDARN
jgi:hypothetical protein